MVPFVILLAAPPPLTVGLQEDLQVLFPPAQVMKDKVTVLINRPGVAGAVL